MHFRKRILQIENEIPKGSLLKMKQKLDKRNFALGAAVELSENHIKNVTFH